MSNYEIVENWQIGIYVMLGVTVCKILFLGRLLVFHIIISSRGQTTYDYVIE